MKYTIVGAGGLGGLQGAWMSRAGCDVVLVDRWEEHVRAINEDGLHVDGSRGRHRIRVRAITPAELEELAPLEMVIIAVKAHDTRGALEQLLPHSSEHTAFVSMQSGQDLGVYGEIVGLERTIGASPHYGGALVDPGHLEAGFPNYIWIGELDGSLTPRLRRLQRDLSTWTPTFVTDDIWGTVWSKFAAGFQAVATSITDRPSGEALSDISYKLVSGAIIREAVHVFDTLGVRLEAFDFHDPAPFRVEDADDTQGLLFWMKHAWPRHEVFRKNGFHKYVKTGSGMRWDILHRGRASDATARLSVMSEVSSDLGVPIPLITALIRVIQEIEGGTRDMSDENYRHLAAIFEQHGGGLPL